MIDQFDTDAAYSINVFSIIHKSLNLHCHK